MESLDFFYQKVEKDLQPVLPSLSFKEWSDRLVTAHQLPTEWRATCIPKAIEDALQAVFSATDVAPPPPASYLRSALLAWGIVVEQHEVQIHSCYSNALPHMTKNSLPMMCIQLAIDWQDSGRAPPGRQATGPIRGLAAQKRAFEVNVAKAVNLMHRLSQRLLESSMDYFLLCSASRVQNGATVHMYASPGMQVPFKFQTI
jgi:hypothetical protein